MNQINEPVNVWAFFNNTKIEPHIFFWQNRRIKIDKINLVHHSRDGDQTFYYFSVLAENNFFRLKFDPAKFKWWLEQVEEGD